MLLLRQQRLATLGTSSWQPWLEPVCAAVPFLWRSRPGDLHFLQLALWQHWRAYLESWPETTKSKTHSANMPKPLELLLLVEYCSPPPRESGSVLVSLHGDDPPWLRPQWSLWCWHVPGSLSWIHKMKLEVGRYWIRCNLLVTNIEWRSSVLPTGSQLVQEPVFSVWTKPSIELDLGQHITNLHHADCWGSVQSFQIKRCVKRFSEGFFLFKTFSIFASSFWNRWFSR